MRAGNWEVAATLAARDGQVAADVIEWHRLRAGRGSFEEVQAFLARRSDWPGEAYLRRQSEDAVIGLNLGANKDSDDRAADFARVLETCRDHLDFATVNVSSPNTEKLRDLQGPDALRSLLSGVMAVRGACPVFLKIIPTKAPVSSENRCSFTIP